jgi:hypothetical protein
MDMSLVMYGGENIHAMQPGVSTHLLAVVATPVINPGDPGDVAVDACCVKCCEQHIQSASSHLTEHQLLLPMASGLPLWRKGPKVQELPCM